MRRRALAVSAAGCALVAVAVITMLTSGHPGASVGPNVVVTRSTSTLSLAVDNSPTLARNPLRPANIVVSYRVDRPGYSAALGTSDDGGATWTARALPLPPDVPACSATTAGQRCPFGPDLAFGPDGKLYVLYVSLRPGGNDPGALWLSTSTDGGKTLAPPVQVAGEYTFQARLAVDGRGSVFVTWLQAFATGNLSFATPYPVVDAVRSDDGGRSFSAPVQVSDPDRERIGAASPAVDGHGRLVVLYEDFKNNRRDFSALPGPPAEQPFALVVAASPDRGASFGRGVEVDAGVVATRRFLIYLPEYPSLAAAPDGTLYVSWADGRNGDDDVFLRRSSDGGRTWSAAVRVNDNRLHDGTAQFLPKVAVGAGGRVDVVFLDRRRDPRNILTDAFLATSHDGGRTFANVRLSSVAFDSRIGPTFGPDYGTDFGTRLGLTSGGTRTLAAWTDTRLATAATGAQDIAFTGARPATAGRAVSALLAVGALVVVVLLGGAALAVGRKKRQPPAAPDTR